jgi:tetratricopeptide (TPR) repeat protein
LVATALVVPLALLAANAGDAADWMERQYDAFVQARKTGNESTRFATGGGDRSDHWRVALRQFRDQPLKGVGAGNYDTTYYLERHSNQNIRQPHSLEIQALSELGVIGALAVLVFVLGVLWALVRGRSSGALATAAGGTFLVWLLHTSVDWLHLIPGVTGVALGAAAILLTDRETHGPSRGLPRFAAAAACLAVIGGAVMVGRPLIAQHLRDAARDRLRSDPAASVRKANDSLGLDPQNLSTLYVKSAAFARLDDYRSARSVLLEATRLEPHDFVPWALAGDLAVRRGDLGEARRAYRRALRLNPRDITLRALARDPGAAEALRRSG